MRNKLLHAGTMKMKLLIYLVLLSSLPVALMGWFAAAYSSSTITAQTLQQNAATLRNLEKEMNNEFKKIDDLMLQYSYQNSSFNEFIQSSLSYTEYSKVWDLYNVLANLRSGMSHAAEIDFYNVAYRQIITSSGGIFDEQEFGDKTVLENARNAVQGIWIDTREDINPRLPGRFLAYTRPIQNKSTSKIDGVIIIYMDASSISRSILSQADSQTEYMVLDRSGKILMHTDAEQIGQRVQETALTGMLAADDHLDGTESRIRLKGVESLVNIRYSPYRDWFYVSSVPLKLLTHPSDRMRNLLLSISLGLVVLALFLAIAASKNLYSPIKRLMKRSSAHTSWDGSNELHHISSYIDSVEKDNEVLQNRIGMYREEVHNYALFQMLLGNAKNSLLPGELGFSGGGIVLYLVEVEQLYLESRYSRSDQFLYYFAVQNIAEEILKRDGHVKIMMMQPGLFAVIHQGQDGSRTGIPRERANRILEAVHTYLKLPSIIAVSESARGLPGLHESYAEGVKALRYSFIYGHDQVIICSELDPAYSAEAEELDACEHEILQALQREDLAAAEKHFSGLVEWIRDNYPFSHEEMFGYFASLSGRMWNTADQQFGPLLEAGAATAWVLELAGQRTILQMQDYFQESFFGILLSSQREGRAGNERQLIEKVVSYIGEHYDEDLSLQVCAELVGLNTFQLSRMFKKVTRVNFVDYVINLRIGIAKELLAEPDAKVSDISEKLRYASPKSFIRLFKRVTGVTPGHYKKQLLQEEK